MIPTTSQPKTQSIPSCSRVSPSHNLKLISASTIITLVSAAGIAFFKILIMKFPRIKSLFGICAKKKLGTPIVNIVTNETWVGKSGYMKPKPIESSATMNEKTFFTKNNEPERSKLFTTRRPSSTICGIREKSESSSTNCATCEAAWEPEAIATEQSASFKAKISFTPSPVIATVCPAFCKIFTILRFSSGFTRPKTVFSNTIFSKSHPSDKFERSTNFLAFLIPAFSATIETVSALSPEITFTSTPCSAK